MPSKKPRHKPGEPPIRAIDYTVDENDCWVWNWPVHRKGYASVWIDGRGVKAHRVAYERENGPIPEGMVIRHICPNGGNPSCVNPAHLRAGTPSENAWDMAEAGNQGNQKLLPADAAEIRRLFVEDDLSRRAIARLYPVGPSNVGKIIANEGFYDPDYTPPPKQSTRKPAGRGLNFAKAKEIRQLRDDGMSQKGIADQFGVSQSIISAIIRNLRYPDPNYTVPPRKAVNQKLTKAQADEIREKIRQGITLSALSIEYRVSQTTVSHINAGKVHTGIPRQYPVKAHTESEPSPPLRSTKEPASTGKAMQAKRQGERNSGIRPKHLPGEPSIDENDWTLDLKTGCHIWRWGDENYRQLIRYKGKRELDYRVSWELNNGPIPKGYQINHSCNNGRCINPEHLYIGDQFDNMRDTTSAGNHATQKLTWAQVREIRAKYEPGKTTHKKLGLEYGVTGEAIGNVLKNKTFYDPAYTPNSPEVSVRRRLAIEDAATIRLRYRTEQVSMGDLARDFSVSITVITGIIHNKTYQDAAYTPPTADFIQSRRGAVAGEKISQAIRDSGKGA